MGICVRACVHACERASGLVLGRVNRYYGLCVRVFMCVGDCV